MAQKMQSLVPAASWSHRLDGDLKRRHDFRNLVVEYRLAVERGDALLTDYLYGEILRAYDGKDAPVQTG